MRNFKEDQSEQKYRDMSDCPACGDRKGLGPLLCWDCFKYRTDITPFKYYNGDIESWLKEQGVITK